MSKWLQPTTPILEGLRIERYLDYETVGEHGAMPMVIASGTALIVTPDPAGR